MEKRHVKGSEYVQVFLFLLFVDTCIVVGDEGPGWLNELGRWI